MRIAFNLLHCLPVFFLLILFSVQPVLAQTPGLIYKPATNGGNKVLDPNGDGYVSKTTAGFPGQNMDEGSDFSEVPYKPFPVFMNEPLTDLSTGNKGGHTDFAPKVYDATGNPIGSPLAMHFDGSNFLYRVRLGGQSTASKGYSVLIDIDNDVSGSGVNPGFEFEVVLATNFDVRIYDHRTNTTGGDIIFNGSVDQYSQKAIASSLGGGDPDYFYDFYVPMTAFNGAITANTPLRMTGVTVTSAKSGIFGVASDLGGVNDQKYGGNTTGAWKDAVTSSPSTTPTGVQTGEFPQVYAVAPIISEPVFTTSNSITGYSVEAAGSIISVYQGTTLLGSTTVSTSGTWTLSNSSFSTPLVANGVITATVSPSTKTASAKSAEVIVKTVQSMCKTEPPIITDNDGTKGFLITTLEAGTIRIYKKSGASWLLDKEFPDTTPGQSKSYQYGSGAKSLPDGTYYATLVPSANGGCESESSNEVCFVAGNGNNGEAITDVDPPVITTTSLNLSSVLLQGTTNEPGSTVVIYKNGVSISSFQLPTGATTWSYTLSDLVANDVFYAKVIRSTSPCNTQLSSGRSNVLTVVDTTIPAVSTAPTITGSYCGTTSSITGTSTEAPGTTIKLFDGTTPLDSTTVNAYGFWTITDLSLLPGATVRATATASNKTESTPSFPVTIGTVYNTTALAITGPTPVIEGGTTVSGTAPAGAWVTLHINGEPYLNSSGDVVTVQAVGGNWTISNISPFELYAGAKLTITAKASATSTCESAPSAAVEVQCKTADASIATSLTKPMYCPGDNAVIKLSSSENGTIYNIYIKTASQTDDQAVVFSSSVLGTGAALNLTSYTLTDADNGKVLFVRTVKVGAPCTYKIGGDLTLGVYGPVPNSFTLSATNQNGFCPGTSSVITVHNAVLNYSYQLIENNASKDKIGAPVVPTVAGDLDFPAIPVSVNTSYGVIITRLEGGCVAENINDKIITISRTGPTVDQPVTPGTATVCVNSAISFSFSTQSSTYTYNLVDKSDPDVVIATTIGNNGIGTLTTGSISIPGVRTYQIQVIGGGCTSTLISEPTITVANGPATVSAGTAQTVCGSSATLQGSNPAPGTGRWTISTKPASAATPFFTDDTQYNTEVSGLVSGKYEFIWTVTSACDGTVSSSLVEVNVNCPAQYSLKTTKFIDEYQNGDVLVTMTDPDGGITGAVVYSGVIPPGTTLSATTGQLTVSDKTLLLGNTAYTYTARTTDGRGKTSDSQITLRMYNPASVPPPLPFAVELASFKALYSNNQVNLVWVTASEFNNDYFTVERSLNGRDFEAIGTVKGNGTTTRQMKYTFTDTRPAPGTSYYRLKQVDFDGKYAYSKLVSASVKQTSGAIALAYPNPFRLSTTLELVAAKSEPAILLILDARGAEVKRETISLSSGINKLVVTLPSSSTGPGLYFVKVTGETTRASVKLLKEN